MAQDKSRLLWSDFVDMVSLGVMHTWWVRLIVYMYEVSCVALLGTKSKRNRLTDYFHFNYIYMYHICM